jgi:hypothetical protein
MPLLPPNTATDHRHTHKLTRTLNCMTFRVLVAADREPVDTSASAVPSTSCSPTGYLVHRSKRQPATDPSFLAARRFSTALTFPPRQRRRLGYLSRECRLT